VSRWFRHYAGMMRDEKLVRAAMRSNQPVERVIWVWGAILESAAEINDGGRYDFDASEAAYFLRANEVDILAILTALEGLDRLHNGVVAKWGDRQYQSDTSAARQRAYRDRRRLQSDADLSDAAEVVTVEDSNSDGEVTASDRHHNNEVTPASVYVSVSDSRTSAEKITDEFEIWYDAYPRHVGRGAAHKAYRTARKKADAETLLAGAKAAANKFAGTDQQFIPYPATWLNGEHWLNEDLQPPKPLPEISNGQVYVLYGTDAGDAWEAHYRTILQKPPPRDNKGGWHFPTEYPPQNVQRATIQAA